jgi:hypothetical protein
MVQSTLQGLGALAGWGETMVLAKGFQKLALLVISSGVEKSMKLITNTFRLRSM